jgi:peptidoglycan/LPS O-acetylase OafA/YrhL/lysophospholipase L1-like esterase
MKRIVGLSSFRGVGILFILIYHFYRPALPGGFVGVDIFFALSGFLITCSLLADFEKSAKLRYFHFLGKRFKKILPPLILMLIVALSLGFFVRDFDILAGIRNRTLEVATFSTNIAQIISGGSYEASVTPNIFLHTWVLGIEMQFYLVFPLLILLLLKIFRGRNRLLSISAVSILLAGCSALLMYLYGARFNAPDRAYFGPDTHSTALFLGASLAGLYMWLKRWHSAKVLPVTGLALILATFILIGLNMPFDSFWTFRLGITVASILAVAAILFVLSLQPKSYFSKIPKLLAPTEFLGNISYGLYLFHFPLLILLPFVLPAGAPYWTVVALTLAASFALAIFSYYFLESGKIFTIFTRPNVFKISAFVVIFAALLILPVKTLLEAPEMSSTEESFIDNSAAVSLEIEPPAAASPDDPIGAAALAEIIKENILPVFADAYDDQLEASRKAAEEARRKAEAAAAVASTSVTSSADVLIIGDSVTLGAKPTLLSKIPNALVDAAVSRNMRAAAGLLSSYKSSGRLPKYIVISLVTNDASYNGDTLQNLLTIAGDGHIFIFVTGYAGTSQPRERHNTIVKDFASARSNVYIADWWSAAVNNPSYLAPDGIHLTGTGMSAFTGIVLSALQRAGA